MIHSAVCINGHVVSNLTACQKVHELYGGVVPNSKQRAYKNIVPVVSEALKKAAISSKDVSAIAFTHGPRADGALLVGGVFAKSMAQALHVPLMKFPSSSACFSSFYR